MKSCDYFIALMHMYIDGEPENPAELFEHIGQCPECKSLFDDYSALAQATRAIPAQVPDTLHGSIMHSVARERRHRRAVRIARIALPFAACAALAAAVILPGGLRMDGGKSAAAESQEQNARIQGFGLESAPGATVAATAAAAQPNGGGEITNEKEGMAEDRLKGSLFLLEEPYECPPIAISRTFAQYVVAEGDGDMPDFEALELEVTVLPAEDEPHYLIVKNDIAALDTALDALGEAGFKIYLDLTGAPEADPEADSSLIVVIAR